jgi:3'-5' exoribonuclease
MVNQKELTDLSKGDPVDHFLLISKMETRNTKSGKDFLSLELSDKSLSLTANVWDNFEELAANGKTGSVVKVKGTIEEWQGTPQIRINSIQLANEKDNVSPGDFLSKSSRDYDVMVKEFKERISKIENPFLQKLIESVFNEERFKKFSSAPAGKSWHHSYIHGLLEHTLEIIRICDLMSNIHTEINRDLLVCGAMLHDLGKIVELSFDSAFEYTDEGKLLGHIVIASMIVNKEIENIPDFPSELRKNLLHLVLSHQGKLEYASPVVPKTLEAITLYQADELSAKVNAYKNAILTQATGESGWTKFISLAQTDLHKHDLGTEKEKLNRTLFD